MPFAGIKKPGQTEWLTGLKSTYNKDHWCRIANHSFRYSTELMLLRSL